MTDLTDYNKERERIAAALAAIEGLSLFDCLQHFDRQATERDNAIYDLCPNNENITPAEGVVVSEGEDGDYAWVLAWVHVGLEGEELPGDDEEVAHA